MLNCKVGRGSKYKSEWHKQEESSFLDGTQEISCGDLRYTHDLVIVMSTLVIHKTSIHSQQFDIISFIHSLINIYQAEQVLYTYFNFDECVSKAAEAMTNYA